MKPKTVKASDYQFIVEGYIDGVWKVITDVPLVAMLKMQTLFPFDPHSKQDITLNCPTRYYFRKDR